MLTNVSLTEWLIKTAGLGRENRSVGCVPVQERSGWKSPRAARFGPTLLRLDANLMDDSGVLTDERKTGRRRRDSLQSVTERRR